MQYENNENHMFTYVVLQKVNNSRILENREEYAIKMNRFRKGFGLVANLLFGSLLKKGYRDLEGGNEISPYKLITKKSIKFYRFILNISKLRVLE